MNETETKPIRLPLWKACLDEMLEQGVAHGQTYETKWFEERLRMTRDCMRFGLDISEIRRELEKRGYYLCGRGQNGNQYVILPPENNADVMAAYSREATRALARGVILGTNTRLDLLSAEDRRRHESMLAKLATKAALCAKPKQTLEAMGEMADSILKLKAPPQA